MSGSRQPGSPSDLPANFGSGARDAPWFRTGPTARVLELLNGNGEEARVVGGAIRNALLNVPIGDVDIATTALPEEVMRRARKAGIKSVPTGIDHGTVTLVIDSHPFEVTTLREDTETFGRRAKVAFGRDWERDAERRDFTINGLSVDAEGRIHDHVGGLDDIAARRVRFIGDPAERIAEDYLRILRFFRIHATYGIGEPDHAGYLACINARQGLATLSAERVRVEILKLVVAEGAAVAITAMAEGGLLLPIFGGIAYTGPFTAMVSAERALALTPDPVRRLGALAVAVTEDARRLAVRLRLTNAEAEALDSMGHRWWRLAGMDEATARRRLYRLGENRYRDRLLLAWARAGSNADAPSWRELATLPDRWVAPKFPLKAADFIARGIARGPALGRALALAEDAWLAAEFPLERPALEAIADETVARLDSDGKP
jgi:poly(A) polymerase